MTRRRFAATTAAALAVATQAGGQTGSTPPAPPTGRRFRFAVKSGMVNDPGAVSWEDKCRLLLDMGYDGVEMDSQYAVPVKEAVAAIETTGLPVHGVVNANHWSVRLSDPSADIRAEAVKQLGDAIRFARAVGAATVLLVPGAVRDAANENAAQVWSRSLDGIRQVLPLAAEAGVRIGIETVWNGFLYDPRGGADQSPDALIRYLREINSAWVGAYIDLSNFRKFASIPQWLRALGRDVIKVDTKDFKVKEDRFCDIGDGDVDWPATRQALADINYFGWVTSEVAGGDRARLADNLARMRKVLA